MAQQLTSPEQIARTLYRYDVVAKGVGTPDEVGAEQIRQYWEQGYLVVGQLLTPEEINLSIEAIMDIMFLRSSGAKIQFTKNESELKTPEERELAVRKISDFVQHEDRLHAIAYHAKLLGLVEKIMGAKPKLTQDQALLKPPSGGAEKPWHQDMAYGNLTYDKPVIGAWIALDPAEIDNGCMHVIPRSHMDGAIPHYAVRDWQICDTNIPVQRDTAVPLQPGEVLLFHGLLMHGTPPNFSTKRRRALQFHYAPAAAEKMSPFEYKRMFTNEIGRAHV